MKKSIKMLKTWTSIITILSFLVFIDLSQAEPLFTGVWETYDLSHTPRSYVKFYQTNNTLQGKIVKILPTNKAISEDTCTNCPSPWKNRKKLGLVIIWGLKKEGNSWKNGYVLDTDSGKIYRCQLSLADDNQTMHFRAYIAQPLLGKTIDWKRVN